ncbi:MAG: hypothetical protein HYS38_00425 [Acidobacteria bacterium]|nr:hypothetical protein [Acidobacteriota bacterium]
MTADEELSQLEDNIRRLKIEFDIYFNGASPRPPNDLQWRVERLIKKYSDSSSLTFAQRFRYNGLTQRYALFAEMWRQKVRVREEGPRQTAAAARESKKEPAFRTEWSDPASEPDKVEKLYAALLEAKRQLGENTDNLAPETFQRFVSQKTAQLKRDFHCEQVEYAVEVEEGQVRLKAKSL